MRRKAWLESGTSFLMRCRACRTVSGVRPPARAARASAAVSSEARVLSAVAMSISRRSGGSARTSSATWLAARTRSAGDPWKARPAAWATRAPSRARWASPAATV